MFWIEEKARAKWLREERVWELGNQNVGVLWGAWRQGSKRCWKTPEIVGPWKPVEGVDVIPREVGSQRRV